MLENPESAKRKSEVGNNRVFYATLSALVAMVGVLAILAMLSQRPETARRRCADNLERIGLALQGYHDAYGCFPPAAITDKEGRPLLSWRVAILPFLEGHRLDSRFDLDQPWDSPHNLPFLRPMPDVFDCPSDGTLEPGMTGYQVVVGPGTVFTPDFKPLARAAITDGCDVTILVGESQRGVPWTKPEDIRFDSDRPFRGFVARHTDRFGYERFHVVFADGSVKALVDTLPPWRQKAMLTRDAGDAVDDGSF